MIAIRADSSKNIGMGHLMRCISIAKELIKKNENIIFLISKDTDVTILNKNELNYYILNDVSDSCWSIGCTLDWIINNNCNKILIDSYRISEDDFIAIGKNSKIFYIDDYTVQGNSVEAIINYNLEATKLDYLTNGLKAKKLFLGPNYFPIRDEFTKKKNHLLNSTVKNVLITTSSTDPCSFIKSILNTDLIKNYNNINFNILIGNYYSQKYISEIKQFSFPNLFFLDWGKNMADLLSNMDLVIAPGSTVIYESLSMGVPCISYIFVDNHKTQCEIMNELGIVPSIDDIRDNKNNIDIKLRKTFEKELNYKTRKEQYDKFKLLFDKKGSERISNIIINNS